MYSLVIKYFRMPFLFFINMLTFYRTHNNIRCKHKLDKILVLDFYCPHYTQLSLQTQPVDALHKMRHLSTIGTRKGAPSSGVTDGDGRAANNSLVKPNVKTGHPLGLHFSV